MLSPITPGRANATKPNRMAMTPRNTTQPHRDAILDPTSSLAASMLHLPRWFPCEVRARSTHGRDQARPPVSGFSVLRTAPLRTSGDHSSAQCLKTRPRPRPRGVTRRLMARVWIRVRVWIGVPVVRVLGGDLAGVLDLGLLVPQHRRAFPFHGVRDRTNDDLLLEDGTLADPDLFLVQRNVERILVEGHVADGRGVAAHGDVFDDDLLTRYGNGEVFLFGVDRLVDAHVSRFARNLLDSDLLAHERNPDLIPVGGLRRAPRRGRACGRRRLDGWRRHGRLPGGGSQSRPFVRTPAAQEVGQGVADDAAGNVGDVVVAKLIVLWKEDTLLDHERFAVAANHLADAFSLRSHDEHSVANVVAVEPHQPPPPSEE